MLGALLWGIGASMALAEENEKAKTKNVEDQLTRATELLKEAQGYIENIDDEGDELYDKIEQFLKEIEK